MSAAILCHARRLVLVVAAVAAIAGVHATTATAAVRHIDAACGAHRGRIVVPYLHRYHVRIGPRHAGGRTRCHGRAHRWTNTAGAG